MPPAYKITQMKKITQIFKRKNEVVWKRPQSEYAKNNHPPVTEQEIIEAEKRLGFTLPEALKKQYKLQNGGRIFKENWNVPADNLDRILRFRTLKEESDSINFDPGKSFDEEIENSQKLVIISNHGSSQYLCLSYISDDKKPGIIYFDTTLEPFKAYEYKCFDRWLIDVLRGKNIKKQNLVILDKYMKYIVDILKTHCKEEIPSEASEYHYFVHAGDAKECIGIVMKDLSAEEKGAGRILNIYLEESNMDDNDFPQGQGIVKKEGPIPLQRND